MVMKPSPVVFDSLIFNINFCWLVESSDPHLLSGGSMEFAVSPNVQCHKYEWIEADCGVKATSALDMSSSRCSLYSCMQFCTFTANSLILSSIVGISSGSSPKKSSMSLSNVSVHSCSGVAGSSMIGSHFPLSGLASLIKLFSGRGSITGFILREGFLSAAMGTCIPTMRFSSGPGKASRALYSKDFGGVMILQGFLVEFAQSGPEILLN